MRRILIDHARTRIREKRGGRQQQISLGAVEGLNALTCDEDLLDLDLALTQLAGADSRAARVVELRFFGGASGGRGGWVARRVGRHGQARLEGRPRLVGQQTCLKGPKLERPGVTERDRPRRRFRSTAIALSPRGYKPYGAAAFPITLRAYSLTLVSLMPYVSTTDAMFIASPCRYPSINAAKLF